MENNQHQERLNQIETEIFEIRREMSQFEFKAKKEEVVRKKEIDKLRAKSEESNEAIRNHLRHLSTLAGITFEGLDEMDVRLESASVSLTRKNKT